jgi:competence protein ComEA
LSRLFFKEYFNFSTREKNGLIILFCVLFIIISLNIYINNVNRIEKVDFSEYEEDIDRFISAGSSHNVEIELFAFNPNTASETDFEKLGLPRNVINNILNYREKGGVFYNKEGFQRIYGMQDDDYERLKDYILIEEQRKQRNYKSNRQHRNKSIELFEFDPNTADYETLIELGLRDWQAENIIKYRNSGGVFKNPEDLGKIYGIRQNQVNELKPYVVIDSICIHQTDDYKPQNSSLVVEVNSANVDELRQLRGIGPVYSERIIKYRDRLGGFYKHEQITEVYGIDQAIINPIIENISIDIEIVKKINLNSTSFSELVSHPYIDRQLANILLEYVEFAGEINNINELVEQKALSQEQFNKIEMYLSAE